MNGSKPQPAEIISHPPAVTFATTNVPPPAPLYIWKDDRLELAIWNSFAGLVVRFNARLLRADGTITPYDLRFTPTTDRTRNIFAIPVAEGFLLDVVVTAAGAGPSRGQTFCTVQVIRGPAGASVAHQVVCQDYITNLAYVAWPGGLIRHSVEGPGFLRSITGTNPAAGAEISEAVPTNARWKPRTFRAVLVTAVAVANREATLQLNDGAAVYAAVPSSFTHVASTTRGYNFALGLPIILPAQSVNQSLPLPDVILMPGHALQTNTTNIQAADDWGAPQYEVEEWIET